MTWSEAARAYAEQGWVVVTGTTSPTELEAWRIEADRVALAAADAGDAHERSAIPGSPARPGDRIDPVSDLSPAFAALTRDGRILDPVAAVMGEDPALLKDKLICKPPGAGGYDLHQDMAYFPPSVRGGEQVVIAVLALDASHAGNGCVELAAGCDRLLTPPGTPRDLVPADLEGLGPLQPVPLRAGDLLLFSALAPHRSGPNRSDRPRRHLFFTYAPARHGDQHEDYYAEQRARLRPPPDGPLLTRRSGRAVVDPGGPERLPAARADDGATLAAGAAARSPGVVARRAVEADAEAIRALFAETFGVDRPVAEWTWRYFESPRPSELQVFELDGRLLGHIAYSRFAAYLDGDPQDIMSGGDWMHRPEARGKGLSKLVGPVVFDLLAPIPLSLDFPSDDALAAFQRHSGDRHVLGRVPQWVRWRTGRAVHESNERVPRLVGAALATATSAAAGLRSWRARRAREVTEAWLPPAELDELAARLRSTARCLRVRDGAYVAWRWQAQPGREWSMVAARDRRGRTTGWAVAGVDPASPRTGRIADLLAEDADTSTALLMAATRLLHRRGAELVTCELLDHRPWSPRALRQAGFVERGQGPVAMCGWVRDDQHELATREAWYLTRGDTDFA